MTETDLDDRTYDLIFGVRRSVRYHMHRRRFFELWNSFTVTVSVMGGSAAVAAILSEQVGWLAVIFPAIVAVVGALDLAVGTARQANFHGDLARQFISLEMEFKDGENMNDEDYDRFRRRRLRIESHEPTVLRLLDVMCHYELLRATGDKSVHPKVGMWRRFGMHMFSQSTFARTLAS